MARGASDHDVMRIALVIAAVLAIAGCGAGGEDAGVGRDQPRTAAASDKQALAELHPETWHTDFTRHGVPFREFEPGGPGADGIPPIDDPRYVDQREADRFLKPREPVIAVVQRGHARAYPLQILVWHEIVNDRLGGRPIAVTYCPLCNSSLVFDRLAAGRRLTFGTTGLLRNSDLVMWDRQTQSWWQQFTGTALVGRLTGIRLRRLDAQTLSWRDFKARYPDGDVLSRKTGFDRPYGDNPYQGYDSRDEPLFSPDRTDQRLRAVERVAAVRVGRDTAVVPFTRLAREPVVQARVGGRPAVIFYKPRARLGPRRGLHPRLPRRRHGRRLRPVSARPGPRLRRRREGHVHRPADRLALGHHRSRRPWRVARRPAAAAASRRAVLVRAGRLPPQRADPAQVTTPPRSHAVARRACSFRHDDDAVPEGDPVARPRFVV